MMRVHEAEPARSMSLSSLIVQREVATMRQVEEALARQVIYGGDLVTNLLEVARVDEAVLAELLAESMKLRMAPPGDLPQPPERARALVPPEMASQRSIVPLALEDDQLVLAVAEPLPRELAEQLAFALGMRIEQRAATAVRVRQAISRLYGVPLERRMQRLLARLSGHPAPAGSMPPPLGSMPPVSRVPSPPSAPATQQSAPARRTGTPSYGTASPARDKPEAPVPVRRRKTITGLPAMRLISPPPPAPQPPGPVEGGPDAELESEPPLTPHLPGRRGGLLQREVTASARSPRRRRGPITAEAARYEADEAADPRRAARSVLRLFAAVLRLRGALPRPRRHRRGARRVRRGRAARASGRASACRWTFRA